jgi:hypothetical protein
MFRAFLIATVCCFCSRSLRADEERLWVDATINGKPVKLVLDTGAEKSVLFRPMAERLGLRVTNWPAGKKVDPGKVPYGQAEPCVLAFLGLTNQASFAVIDVPSVLRSEVQGVLGWPVWSGSIIRFDCVNHRFESLDRVPPDVSRWPKFNLRRSSSVLVIDVPDKARGNGSILVDTGNEGGVSLAPELWKEWTAAHPKRKQTIEAYFMPGAGLVAQETSWAEELSFGSLSLQEVPVREANPAEVAMIRSTYRATFGLTALKRLDLVVDGRKGVAYLQPNKSKPVSYEHNRAGAVFVPEDLEKSDDLVARVLPGTPADEANVRDGDVLLKIDGRDATQWRTDPALQPQSRFWEQPAGTKVRLTLKRGAEEFQTEITLRDLIGPAVKQRDETAK